MFNLGDPFSSIVPGARAAILTVLARSATPLTSPTIAKLSKGQYSRAGTLRAINELVAVGVVTATPAGKAKLYSLNRNHVAAAAIEQLVSVGETVFERIRAAVQRWRVPPCSIAVFGSSARGDATPKSDIDLLIIRPTTIGPDDEVWCQQLADLGTDVTAWSGNPCDIVEYSESELQALVAADDPLVANLRRDAVTLFGSSTRALTKRRADR